MPRCCCGLEIPGLCIIEPTVHGDERGYFMETYHQKEMQEAGLDMVFVQDNQSMSRKGVLRGLHYQKHFPQGKLVRVIRGAVFDVAVDLRKDSLTFGQWESFELSAENHCMLYIPKGFAHGFLALEDNSVLNYLCGDRYDAESEDGVLWRDPELSIPWPLEQVENIIISPRDEGFQTMAQFKQTYGAISVEG